MSVVYSRAGRTSTSRERRMDLPEQPSLEQLVQLIELLYTDKDAKRIAAVQAYLQGIQKSDGGLHLADMLLNDPSLSLNCLFFGALTYTVTLSRFKSQDPPQNIDPAIILQRILEHTTNLIRCHRSNNVSNMFIIRKMFQNLSILYCSCNIQAPGWANPLASLAHILSTSTTPNIGNELQIEQVVQPLLQDAAANSMILGFGSVIIEDLTNEYKSNSGIKQGETANERVIADIYPITKSIVIYNLQSNNEELQLTALQTLGTWLQYISFVHNNSQVRYRDLNDIWQYVLMVLEKSKDEVLMKTIDFLALLFEDNPTLMNYDLRMKFENMIPSQWSMGVISQFMQAEDYESLNRLSFLFARYLESDVFQVVVKMLSNENKELMQFLLNLTNFPLKPIVEEELSSNFIEFWSSIIEIFTQDRDMIKAKVHEDEAAFARIVDSAHGLFGELTKIYFDKLRLGPVIADSSFRDSEQDFTAFRDNVAELFDSLYTEVGSSLYDGLTSAIASSNDIDQIEVSFFLLTNISTNLSEQTDDEGILHSIDKLFEANFLNRVSEIIVQQHLTDLHIRFSIKFLGEIDFYFMRRDATYAKTVIDYLFSMMKTFPDQQFHIARTIMDICDNCREKLVGSIPSFEPMLLEMINNTTINTYTREKFINSISCIIQAIPDPSAQEDYIFKLLRMIETTAQPYLQKASHESLHEGELDYITSLFNSVNEMAKGLSVPDDMSIYHEQEFNTLKNYWENYHGKVHEKVKSIVKAYSLDIESLAMSTDISFTAIQIYKAGLFENFGAFALPYSEVMEYAFQKVQRCNFQKSYQDILDLMATLLNCGLRKKQNPNRSLGDHEVSIIIKSFVADHYNLIENDPDFIQGAIDIFTAVVTHNIGFLLRQPDTLKFMAGIALPLLLSKEKFVIKAVCKFWQKLLGSYSKTSREEEEMLRHFIETEIGPVLSENLLRGIIDASRSELEQYGLVLITMVVKHPLQLKVWFTNTLEMLHNERLANGKHGLDTRDMFLKKILVTRGSPRQCNDALKSFWQDSNALHWNTA